MKAPLKSGTVNLLMPGASRSAPEAPGSGRERYYPQGAARAEETLGSLRRSRRLWRP